MPNVNAPFGLKPIKTINGGLPDLVPCKKDASANIIYRYAPVIMSADGNIDPATDATVPVYGVSVEYGATATAETLMIAPAFNHVFEVQCNTSATIGQTNCGNNASLVFTAGSTTTKLSKAQIIASSIATTNNIVRIQRIIDRPDNTTGSFSKVAVVFNLHRWPSGAGQVGI